MLVDLLVRICNIFEANFYPKNGLLRPAPKASKSLQAFICFMLWLKDDELQI